MRRAAVFSGGPDAERAVSLESGRGVSAALRAAGFDVIEAVLEGDEGEARLATLAAGATVFPALHGAWGEGGALQELLDAARVAYVGCGPAAARLCMDKMATKLAAASAGVRTAPAALVDARSARHAIGVPCAVKPVHEGSSVGLYLCRDDAELEAALDRVRGDQRARPWRVYMVERLIEGREITVGLVDDGGTLRALPHLLIEPKRGAYDYYAKYEAEDTAYRVGGPLGEAVDAEVRASAELVCAALGVRHLARVDFLVDRAGVAWMLEVNTMPGFTSHSLLPMAAAAAGVSMPVLCSRLIEAAERDAPAALVVPAVEGRG